MSYRPTTKKGYNLYDVASCLQKAIRRNDPKLAGYMALELFESGYALYAWKRLLTMTAEDCADILTQEIKALFDSWLIASNDGKKKSRMFIGKAVLVLCAARKCRDADHLANYIYDRDMLDMDAVFAALDEARLEPERVMMPDYTFDCHTASGKRAGKTKHDFFVSEGAAITPKQKGLFDDVIHQPLKPRTDSLPQPQPPSSSTPMLL